MDGFASVIGALLSRLRDAAGIPVCPGEWLWTVSAAGVVLGAAPVLAALLVAVVRRWTGNRYSAATLSLFGLLGLVGGAVIPLGGFAAVSAVFTGATAGVSRGLSPRDLDELRQGSCLVGSQGDYLASGRTVAQALGDLPGPDVLVSGRVLALLVVLPLLALLGAWSLGRLAVRRGPHWPGRLLWLPSAALLAGSLPLAEGVVGQLWLGYVPAGLAGSVLVLMVGRPRRKVAKPVPPAPHPGPPEQPSGTTLAQLPGPLPATLGATAATGGRPGAVDGRFQRVRQLGGGGFGNVWLARDTVLDRDVAVKVARVPDAETEQRIRREARALAAVHHPHCVRVYDIVPGFDGMAGLAIVMQYVAGHSLLHQVDSAGPLSDTSGAQLWMTLAGALEAAHAGGVLHRDVKPSNVIIDEAGRANLIDFGIARSSGDATLTRTGGLVGTPDYLCPEVAAGAPADVASDAWQLAATMSFALTGQPPRGRHDDVFSALTAAQQQPPTQLPERSAHLPLLRRALHPDPAQRPSPAEVQEQLGEWLRTTGGSADGPVTTRLAAPPSGHGADSDEDHPHRGGVRH